MFLRPNDPLKISTLDGINGTLLEPLAFRLATGRLLRARIGATTDGLSSPKFVKCDLQTSNSYFPSVAHDAGYRGDLEESLDEGATWQPVQLTKDECDNLLAELLRANEVPEKESWLIFEAVHEFGQAAWEADAVLRSTTSAKKS